jgi:hypothetical protein
VVAEMIVPAVIIIMRNNPHDEQNAAVAGKNQKQPKGNVVRVLDVP